MEFLIRILARPAVADEWFPGARPREAIAAAYKKYPAAYACFAVVKGTAALVRPLTVTEEVDAMIGLLQLDSEVAIIRAALKPSKADIARWETDGGK